MTGQDVKVWKIRHLPPGGAYCHICNRSILRLQQVAEVAGLPFAHATCYVRHMIEDRTAESSP